MIAPHCRPRPALSATCLVLVLGLAPTRVAAWGPVAHQLVTSEAIETLPKELKTFYKRHRAELPSLALDAEFQEEGPDRRFAADLLAPFPFDDVPRSEKALKERFGATADRVGRLPWLIHDAYSRLTEAFRAADKGRILAESDALASLVADLHNPLALTENADGQMTEQHGLWVRLGQQFPQAAEKALKLKPDAAHFLDDPYEHVFSLICANYIWVDNLLYHEDLAHRGRGGYTELYYEALADRVAGIVNGRLSQAAAESGSFWYTAWSQAGRPALE
jgi:hypothetical protein